MSDGFFQLFANNTCSRRSRAGSARWSPHRPGLRACLETQQGTWSSPRGRTPHKSSRASTTSLRTCPPPTVSATASTGRTARLIHPTPQRQGASARCWKPYAACTIASSGPRVCSPGATTGPARSSSTGPLWEATCETAPSRQSATATCHPTCSSPRPQTRKGRRAT